MPETKFHTEHSLTGNTKLLIEDIIWVNKSYNRVGISIDPQTNLDVNGQIRLTSGTTYNEGELRYKDKNLWINTGGTTNDWYPLICSSTTYQDTWILISPSYYSSSPSSYGPTATTLYTGYPSSLDSGVAIKWRSGATSNYYFDEIVDITTIGSDYLMEVRGAPFGNGNCISELYYSKDRGMVHVETFVIPGNYEDSSTNTLLEDDLLMKKGFYWTNEPSVIVGLSGVHMIDDSAGAGGKIGYPTVTPVTSGDVLTTPLNIYSTMNHSKVEISTTNYKVNYGSYIEFKVATIGNGDASDLTLYLVIIKDQK